MRCCLWIFSGFNKARLFGQSSHRRNRKKFYYKFECIQTLPSFVLLKYSIAPVRINESRPTRFGTGRMGGCSGIHSEMSSNSDIYQWKCGLANIKAKGNSSGLSWNKVEAIQMGYLTIHHEEHPHYLGVLLGKWFPSTTWSSATRIGRPSWPLGRSANDLSCILFGVKQVCVFSTRHRSLTWSLQLLDFYRSHKITPINVSCYSEKEDKIRIVLVWKKSSESVVQGASLHPLFTV